MSYYGYPKYVTAAEKKAKAAKSLEKLRKKNPDLEPIIIEGRSIVKSWWGKAWNMNLESYADYVNRIGRGKTYVRNGAVLDLKISKGKVQAKVQGTRAKPYDVEVLIDTLEKEKWHGIAKLCNRRIDTLEELLEGKFPKDLEIIFKDKEYTMFPSTDEIHFNCSCPDWAYMCKHVAAVLYGIGARLDQNPLLFFQLRDVDGHELIRKSMEEKIDIMLANADKKSIREIAEEDISRIFEL